MGTWGTSGFEDDTAMEFYDDFCSGELSLLELEEAIDLVLEQEYDMDELLMEGFTEPINAIISAEILAAAKGNKHEKFPTSEYHDEMDLPVIDFDALNKKIQPLLIEKVQKVIAKIASDDKIHLHVLWKESESFQEWKDYLEDLQNRIK